MYVTVAQNTKKLLEFEIWEQIKDRVSLGFAYFTESEFFLLKVL